MSILFVRERRKQISLELPDRKRFFTACQVAQADTNNAATAVRYTVGPTGSSSISSRGQWQILAAEPQTPCTHAHARANACEYDAARTVARHRLTSLGPALLIHAAHKRVAIQLWPAVGRLAVWTASPRPR